MEKLGLIKNAQLQVDLAKLGMDITAFLGVYLQKSSLYDDVVTALKAIPEIMIVFIHHIMFYTNIIPLPIIHQSEPTNILSYIIHANRFCLNIRLLPFLFQ